MKNCPNCGGELKRWYMLNESVMRCSGISDDEGCGYLVAACMADRVRLEPLPDAVDEAISQALRVGVGEMVFCSVDGKINVEHYHRRTATFRDRVQAIKEAYELKNRAVGDAILEAVRVRNGAVVFCDSKNRVSLMEHHSRMTELNNRIDDIKKAYDGYRADK